MEKAINRLRQELRETAARMGLPAFWRWWQSELAQLLPGAPKAALQLRRLRPMLVFEADRAVLWEPRIVDGALKLAAGGSVALTGDAAAVPGAGKTLMDSAAQRLGYGVAAPRVVIALARSAVLRRRITLPAAVEENLSAAVAFDLDRLTPFRPEQLYFDVAVVGRDVERKQIHVDLAAALKSTVDAACRHAESWGALVIKVTPDAPVAGPDDVAPAARGSKLNLLPEEDRPETAWWRRPQIVAPIGVLALLGIVAIVLPIWQQREYAIAMTQAAEEARQEAAAVDALRQQLDQSTADYNFILGRKYTFPSSLQLLDDVTRLLPDDTWLTQMEVKSTAKGKEPQREILIRGESANAGRLVSALEESKLFEQAAPRSPTTKIQPGPGEVFDLGAQLKRQTAPEMIQLASAGGAASSPSTPAPSTPALATPALATPALATPAPATPAPATPAPATPAPATPAPATPAPATPAPVTLPPTPGPAATPAKGVPAGSAPAGGAASTGAVPVGSIPGVSVPVGGAAGSAAAGVAPMGPTGVPAPTGRKPLAAPPAGTPVAPAGAMPSAAVPQPQVSVASIPPPAMSATSTQKSTSGEGKQ